MRKTILCGVILLLSMPSVEAHARPRGNAILYCQDKPLSLGEQAKFKEDYITFFRQMRLKAAGNIQAIGGDVRRRLDALTCKNDIPIMISILADMESGKIKRDEVEWENVYDSLSWRAMPLMGWKELPKGPRWDQAEAWRQWWRENKDRPMPLPDAEVHKNIELALRDFFYGTPKDKMAAAEDLDYILKNRPLWIISEMLCPSRQPLEPFASDVNNYLRNITATGVPFTTKMEKRKACSAWGDWYDAHKETFKWPSHVEMLKKEQGKP